MQHIKAFQLTSIVGTESKPGSASKHSFSLNLKQRPQLNVTNLQISPIHEGLGLI